MAVQLVAIKVANFMRIGWSRWEMLRGNENMNGYAFALTIYDYSDGRITIGVRCLSHLAATVPAPV